MLGHLQAFLSTCCGRLFCSPTGGKRNAFPLWGFPAGGFLCVPFPLGLMSKPPSFCRERTGITFLSDSIPHFLHCAASPLARGEPRGDKQVTQRCSSKLNFGILWKWVETEKPKNLKPRSSPRALLGPNLKPRAGPRPLLGPNRIKTDRNH